MKCPYCNHNEDKVTDSREASEGSVVRRRRECLQCGRRFTTYEHIEKTTLMVIKKDGRRESFNHQKIINGLVKACEKREISIEELELISQSVELELQKRFEQEVKTEYIGELLMEKLSQLDDVAYVRFASVYRQFKDVNQFMRELKGVFGRKNK